MIPLRLQKSTSRIKELGTRRKKAITENAIRIENAILALEEELLKELTSKERDGGQIDLIRSRIALKHRQLTSELAGSSR